MFSRTFKLPNFRCDIPLGNCEANAAVDYDTLFPLANCVVADTKENIE